MKALLHETAERAARYLEGGSKRSIAPPDDAKEALEALTGPLPEHPSAPRDVLARLDQFGSPATVASTTGRYFGFVTGGTLPAALAASWLASAWDQNGALSVMSPVNAVLERTALAWLLDLLGLPADSGGGFVTGATMANFTALAAARHALLQRAGWDVEADGLFGAPPIAVVVGDEVHVSVLKALSLLGFGRERVLRVPVDAQGRMRANALPPLNALSIVCTQAGNVNTGAFDDVPLICEPARAAGSWVHVDGAFGLWASASPRYRHLSRGVEQADSWAGDAHKWLNVPYDNGFVACREAAHLHGAMSPSAAAYLPSAAVREPFDYTPEMSRRARGVEAWAALASLGRRGVAELIERTCAHARHFAEELSAAGYDVLNDVALNQVLVSFGDPQKTKRVVDAVQADGTCWCGATEWQGHSAMRISVSCWATTDQDVQRSLAAIKGAAAQIEEMR